MAVIPLTKGYVALVDDRDYDRCAAHKWCAMVQPWGVYASRKDWTGGKPKTVLMHRFVISAPQGLKVDHRDGDGLNNRRGNLRLATTAQNGANRRKQRTSSSPYRGVTLVKKTGHWLASIRVEGVLHRLGTFPDADSAARAYDAAALRLCGEFARLNLGESLVPVPAESLALRAVS